MQLPVTLTLKPSRILATLLVLAHGLVVAEAASLPGTIAAPVVILVLLSLVLSLRRHAYRLPVSALTLKADGTLEVEGRASRGIVEVDRRTTVHSWLVILLLRSGNRGVSLVLPPDALGSEAHRQLRLWLRWKASAARA